MQYLSRSEKLASSNSSLKEEEEEVRAAAAEAGAGRKTGSRLHRTVKARCTDNTYRQQEGKKPV
jgi:hypothetical protein